MSLYRFMLRGANKVRDGVRRRIGTQAAAGAVALDVAHLSEAIRRAERSNEPSPHIYLERILSEPDYARLLASLPKSDLNFDYWIDRASDASTGIHGEYRKRFDLSLERAALRIPGAAGQFWQALHDVVTAPSFVRQLLARYDDLLLQRYGRPLTDQDFVELIGVKTFLMRHAPGYYLGPHTDRHDRIATVILYLPSNDDHPELGTTFFIPREPLEQDARLRPHYTFDKFEAAKTLRYVPNSGVFFPQTDSGFHGVLPVEKDKQGAVRYGMQIQIFDRKAKDRVAAPEY